MTDNSDLQVEELRLEIEKLQNENANLQAENVVLESENADLNDAMEIMQDPRGLHFATNFLLLLENSTYTSRLKGYV